jgi:hypothetical protein
VVYSLYGDHVATLLDEAIAHREHITLGLQRRDGPKSVALPASPDRYLRPSRHLAVVESPLTASGLANDPALPDHRPYAEDQGPIRADEDMGGS